MLGWRTVCAVEIEPYCRDILLARQRDGVLEPFPIWDDVQTFDGRPWRGLVDVVSGGFPCQDISAAGRGAGITGSRSGLWGHMARIVGEVRPRFVFVENSPLLVSRGLDRVLADLAELGYSCRWGIVGAGDAGAPHRRKRIWIVADFHDHAGRAEQRSQPQGGAEQPDGMREDRPADMADASKSGLEGLAGDGDRSGEPGRELSRPKGSACSPGLRWWSFDPADLPDAAGQRPHHQADERQLAREGRSELLLEQSGSAGDMADAEIMRRVEAPNGRPAPHGAGGGGEDVGHSDGCGRNRRPDEPQRQPEGREAIDRAGAGSGSEEVDDAGSGRHGPSEGEVPPRGDSAFHAGSWPAQPGLGRVAHGLADPLDFARSIAGGQLERVGSGIPARVGRLKAIGNGQVPAAAALAWRVLTEDA